MTLALGTGSLAGQTPTGTVSGRVIADNGQPLVGAQVSLRGTGLGTRTGDTGRYTIVNVPIGQYRLRAQMLGHRLVEDSVTVVAAQTVTRDITMRVEALGLDALVITGTPGAARQREVGNAVTQINVGTLPAPPANIGQLLQGRAAGVTVMPSSGMAGSGSMIRLRGNVSVAMSNQPLIYVDGVRIRSDGYQRNVPPTGSVLRSGNDIASPFNDINPGDIERVEVIKGAAAATLYGTEAAAGVIQIFTKRGHSGRPVWTVEADQGFSRALKFGPDPSKAPPGDTIYGCANTTGTCRGTIALYRDSFPNRFKGLPLRGVSRAGGTSSYLFLDPWLRNGYRQRYALSVGGGGEALQYFVSGTMSDDDGVLPNDNEARKVIRGNFSFTPMTNLLFNVTTSYTKNNISNTAAGNNAHGLTLNAFRRDRNYKSNDRPEVVDSLLNQELTSEIDHLVTGGTLTWTPIANLSNKLTVGFDLAQIENRNLRPYGFVSAPLGIISNRRNAYQTLTFDYAGNYSLNIKPDMRSTLSWGGQTVTTEERETSAYGENFAGPGEPTVTGAGIRLGFEERERVVNAGLFGQVLLDLRNRYFLTLGARVDGNSAFGEDFGLQTYPKASFSWVASDERFWPSWSPSMKLRAAWGQSGRAPGAFDAVRNWDPVGWGGAPAVLPRNVGNKDLGPERTTEIELGFDAALFDNRLTSEFTWYKRNIDNALFDVRQVPSLGFLESQLMNVGEMRSDGVELTVNATVVRRGALEWSVGGSLYTNDTEVLSLGGAPDFVLTGDVEGDFGWIMVGQPVPVVRTNECVTNPDAKEAPIISRNPADCVHGPNLPTHTYGVQTSLNMPYGLSLNARGEYMGGHYMYDGAAFNAVTRSVRWPGCYDFYTLQETGRAADATALDRARCTVSSTRADYFVYPADFFKLREVSLSVAIPQRFVRGASSARLTLAGYNLWKWVNKDFPVFDPETGNNGGFDSRVRSILEHVPPPAVYTASVRATF
ncbi:MAG: SusC/RagA family TonB-linked outer membrane protein [Gemmatimonadota bacterium]|nr:SusC/RagA family TonB-linked outer membrane protein [Gemmatimonadota bacterium]